LRGRYARLPGYTTNLLLPDDRCNEDVIKILGLTWNTETDILTIPIIQKSYKTLTKRSVSKSIASTFDPLGLLAPVLLKGKLFLEKLLSISLAWDDELPNDLKLEWEKIKNGWENQSPIHVPRNILLDKSNSTHTLLDFTDASKSAYATTVYLKSVNPVCSQLNSIFSKTRLAPIKPITIPRLELLALTIGFKALSFVEKQIGLKINHKIIFSDSEIVLSWIKSVKPLESFVENRVKPVRESEGIEFRHVAGEDNPADLGSRGISASELQLHNIWWNGPKWLIKSYESWPIPKIVFTTPISPYVNTFLTHNLDTMQKPSNLLQPPDILKSHKKPDRQLIPGSSYIIDLNKFSSLTTVCRILSLVLRYLRKIIWNKINNSPKMIAHLNMFSLGCIFDCVLDTGPLSNKELEVSRIILIKQSQKLHFGERCDSTATDIKDLKNLGAKYDTQNLIRCFGRITKNSPFYCQETID